MWTPEELKEIIEKYNQGEDTGYTDEEYDKLLEEYLKVHGGESARPYTRNKQTDVVNSLVCTLPKIFGVTTPMREGQKTYKDHEHGEKKTCDSCMRCNQFSSRFFCIQVGSTAVS